MKKPIKGLIVYVVIALVIGISIGASFNLGKISAAENTPGSIGDPLASKSYVDAIMDTQLTELQGQIQSVVDASVANSQDNTEVVEEQATDTDVTEETEDTPETSVGTGDTEPFMAVYQVIKLTQGQRLILDESAELILRSGEATAIANVFGNGLTDVTAGVDVGQDETVEWNHLLIAPRPDGRGIVITSTDAYVMVKGQYEIH